MMAEATVKDSLLGMGTVSAYLVKASVMQRMYFFPEAQIDWRGPAAVALCIEPIESVAWEALQDGKLFVLGTDGTLADVSGCQHPLQTSSSIG